MDRFAIFVFSLGLVTLIGCGSKGEPPVAQRSNSGQSAAQNLSPTAVRGGHHGPSPSDVVSQFLDEVRRGGEDSRANDLLTAKAQVELRRIGQSIQPIGSPDARFQVTRAEHVPGQADSALVHSIWSEPNGDGTSSDFQVVWAVQQEPAGWRISGLAMELDPKQDPVIMDFENAEMMAALLAFPEGEPEAASSQGQKTQALAPDPTISR